ncbi:alpha/beta hydrolase [Pedobacter sp. PLR]|uniref:RBBP9/YdeN family alpha/beta hydrolase n=1 Tax=Pedobacter sp. PLR TaxID=2994465 RepID=UPI0022478E5D|nr:alpha/beta hydrolase [Pedobacter sp. PLR]MCX2454022.1 alpha/beta hydrolase [Pedobacter sp. PLR]
MNGKQVYIVHGYMASVKDHWFEWIKTELEKEGIPVHILAMPDSGKPQPEAWINHLKENVKITGETYFVGHSLGCISLLLYLNRYKLKTSGMILVAGFLEQLKDIPELDSFLEEQISTTALIQNVPKRLVIAAIDDDVVPFELTKKQAIALDAPLVAIPNGGHFLGRDGYSDFPELLKELKTMYS